jgi:Tfp pilus assembly protein PilE
MAVRRLAHSNSPLSFLEIALIAVVLGVAAAVAIPEYLQLRQDANDDSAKTRLAQASRNLDAGRAVPAGVVLHRAGTSYCLETTVSGRLWHALRHAKPAQGACPAK